MRDIQGLQVKVLHLRRRKPLRLVDETRIFHGLYSVGELKSTGLPLSETLDAKGGETIVQLYRGEELIAEGKSVCHENDFYCRAIGRQAALGRALKLVGGRIPGEKIGASPIAIPEPAPEF